MRAVVAPEPGDARVLKVVERQVPEPEPGELQVRVQAAGVNRADVMQRQGHYPPPPGVTDILGLEAAGQISALGDRVEGWQVGDRVCALLAGGGYAEYCTVPADIALPWPAGSDAVQAASVYEVFATAFDNLVNRGRLASGETVLVHGGSSGVGTAAIQLAVWLGCRVLATAGSARKLEACRQLGAAAGINYREEDFVARGREATGGEGVDVILDLIGAAYLDRNLRALAEEGRLVVIALQGGSQAQIDLRALLSKRLTLCASTLRARPRAAKAALAAQLRARVWPAFDEGGLRPVVDSVYPLEEAAQAHSRMESSEHIGKIVLTIAP